MEPSKELSGTGVYILDPSDDVINAADAIKKFLELECTVQYNQQLQQSNISISITKIASHCQMLVQQRNCHTHLPPDYFKERNGTVDLFLIPDADLHSTFKLEQEKHHDVIMILGHSSISNIGKLPTLDLLNTFISPPQPSIIAILGCCGGNSRYGLLYKLSHFKTKTIFGFYQRMVSTNELNESSLILGIRNYLCLSKHKYLDKRKIAKQAFVYMVSWMHHLMIRQDLPMTMMKQQQYNHLLKLSCSVLKQFQNHV